MDKADKTQTAEYIYRTVMAYKGTIPCKQKTGK